MLSSEACIQVSFICRACNNCLHFKQICSVEPSYRIGTHICLRVASCDARNGFYMLIGYSVDHIISCFGSCLRN